MVLDNKALYLRCELQKGTAHPSLLTLSISTLHIFSGRPLFIARVRTLRKCLSQEEVLRLAVLTGWSTDDGDVVTILESASNPSSTYCQDQNLALKLSNMGRKWMASCTE